MRYLPLKRDDLKAELENLQRFTENPTFSFIGLEDWSAAPARPFEGMVVKADGATWNPGAGAGVYCYRGGAWTFLG